MDTNSPSAPLGSSRLLTLALAGIVAAFAWFVLSLVIAAPSAHASDTTRGPLDSLGSLVSQATSPVLPPVADLTAPVLQPVADLAQPVIDTVSPAVGGITPVTDAVLEPLAPLVAPASEVVAEVVTPLAPAISPVIDAIRPVTDAVAPVLDPVLAPLQPAATPLPAVTGVTPGAASGAPSPTTAVAAAATATTAIVAASAPSALEPAGILRTSAAAFESIRGTATSGIALATVLSGVPGLPAPWHPFGPAPDASAFFTSGSSSALGASVALAFGLVVAHRAWVRRRRPGDESALPAPILGTDVSPD